MNWGNELSRDKYTIKNITYFGSDKFPEIDFKPDVIHFYWREHRDFAGTINIINKLKTQFGVPVIVQMDWQPLQLEDADLKFANSGNLIVTDTIAGRDIYPTQSGLKVPSFYLGGEEFGENYSFIHRFDSRTTFKNFYNSVTEEPLFVPKSKRNESTREWEDYSFKLTKAEDRKRLWGTMWHTRPELKMDDKFKLMNILQKDYLCRWFCGWTANTLVTMNTWASGASVRSDYYEPYEYMIAEFWEKLSECTCTLDNRYWGISSLGVEAAALNMPHVGTPTVTSAVILNPKLVCPEGDIDKQAETVRWLIDNPDEARKLGVEAHNNFLEHFSLENKIKRYEEALKLVGLK
jgi:hypothetical protein